MSVREVIEDLIQDFETEKLSNLFRIKSRRFRPINEEIQIGEDEDFGNGLNVGEIDLSIDEKICIYAFKVNRKLTERSGKKKQYKIGKSILKDKIEYSGGIFIFYDDEGSFRFSLIYDIPKEGGKRDWSNFKRYTYYVSRNETNKTFIHQIEEADFSSLDSLKEAFSVEKVTEAFYREIANWYFWALKKVKFPRDAEKEQNGRNIAVIRLITRLIFVWFMKQKGLIGDELFNKSKISKYLKSFSDEDNNYYKAILQNLFFATLNIPIKERKFRTEERKNNFYNDDYMNHSYYRYSSLFKNPDDMVLLFKDIPFLNGGLFECLDKAKKDPSNETGREIRIDGFSDVPSKQPNVPNYLFFSDERKEDLNSDYGTKEKKYRVRGLITILSSYNFTIDENTPDDEEVALDPELLGRVFENLLASYNPETATTARKTTGSYYTPRPIVNYMVEQSLKEYFRAKLDNKIVNFNEKLEDLFSSNSELNPFTDEETDLVIESINNLKVLDPAVGSGAFPMGVLHKLVFLLSRLDPHNVKWKKQQIDAVEKNVPDPELKNILKNQIEESFSNNELDYGRKLFLIQRCLYGVDIQPIAIQIAKLRFFISLLVDEKIDNNRENFGIEALPNLETKLVSANTLITNKEDQIEFQLPEIMTLEEELFETRKNYFTAHTPEEKRDLILRDRDIRVQIRKILTNEKSFINNNTERLINWDPYNSNNSADWFDPEWMFGVKDGFDIVIGNPPYIQLQKNHGKLANLYKDKGYETFDRMGDIYALFYERGLNLLKENGILTYISSNKWMRAGYGRKLRNFFTRYNPLFLIDLGPGVFKHATVDTCLIFLQKSQNRSELRGCTLYERVYSIGSYVKENYVLMGKLKDGAWFIGSQEEYKLKEKIERIGKPLKDWDVKIFYGIKTGLNEAFILDETKKQEILDNCKDEEEKRRTEAIIKPILRGRDIMRYAYKWARLYLLFIPWHFPLHNDLRIHGASIKAEKEFENIYPSVYSYLINYKEKLLKRNKDEIGIRYEWYALQRCAATYYSEFEKEKVVWAETDRALNTVLVPRGYFIQKTCFMITGQNLEYINALLNSNVAQWFIRINSCSLGQKGMSLTKESVRMFPIPPIDNKETVFLQIKSIVLKINAIKNKNSNRDTFELEDKINRFVYDIYGLTNKEVHMIESRNR